MHPSFAILRIVHPVGQGGFVSETVLDSGFTVVFDCGCKAKNSIGLLTREINNLKHSASSIDRLVVSHFDEDHVNGLSLLVSAIPIREVLIPFIPKEFRLVYNALTGGAYSQIRSLFEERDIEVNETQEITSYKDPDGIWEWIAFPLLNSGDWTNLRLQMKSLSVDVKKLDDAQYVESKLALIKKGYINVFGTAKMNDNGLLMISQAVREPMQWHCFASQNKNSHLGSLFHRTAAFYSGDANLNGRKKGDVISFIHRHCGRNRLGLLQIPHHGSHRNSSSSLITDFPSDVYYYQDRNQARLLRNTGLYSKLLFGNNLLGIHASASDRFGQLICFPI